MTEATLQGLLAGKRLVAEGTYREDRGMLEEALVLFDGATEHDEYTTLAAYYAGYTHYRLTSLGPRAERRRERPHLAAAIRYLKRATRAETHAPHQAAEAYGLLGFCYSLDISRRPYLYLVDAPAAGMAMGKAFDLAPGNPRILLLQAAVTFNKPALLGGNARAAAAGLEQAVELFRAWEPRDELQPEWGEAESYALLGMIYSQLHERERARDALQRALAIAPQFRRAQRVLKALEAAA